MLLSKYEKCNVNQTHCTYHVCPFCAILFGATKETKSRIFASVSLLISNTQSVEKLNRYRLRIQYLFICSKYGLHLEHDF